MNILTFDIEEWFHILDNSKTEGVSSWSEFECRIHKNIETIFEIIEEKNVSATFFIVGWIAEKYPEIVKKISDKGYEIGSHTHYHQLAYKQERLNFYNDIEKSIKTLEDIIGKKVESFRAPGFSITEKNKWAFEVLYELGIKFDASIFPAGRAHGGFPTYGLALPSIIEYNGIQIKEFPINTHNFIFFPMIFSGGGYFRILPYNLIKLLTKKSQYVMTYFHPRDFDFNQPMVPGLSIKRKFKSYVGLKHCKPKLIKWLNEFKFVDMKTADLMIDWKNTDIVKL